MNQPVQPDTWAAVDGLGREMTLTPDAPPRRADRSVGIFYWTWHNEPRNPPMNNTLIFREHPEALHDVDNPLWQGEFRTHHWDEPLFGYYRTTDRWVLRKHAQLLADALVDVVIFDNTNGTATWRDSYRALMETFAAARVDGVNAPCIAFLLPLFLANPSDTHTQLRELYRDVYAAGFYPELWYRWKGKPLIMAYPDALDPKDPLDVEILNFFTFRPGQPSYVRGLERPDHWGWLSVYPQQVYRSADGTPEQITVGVAQNHSAELGLTAMNGEHIFGRTFTSRGYDERPDAKLWGTNFAEQFEYALRVDPQFIFITGWNEWVAGRFAHWQGVDNAFPDEFDETYSRDVEPCAGGLKDHYYYQMVSFIRRYKGVSPSLPAQAASHDWSAAAVYEHYRGGTPRRDADGYLGTHYSDDSGRNDIVRCLARHDGQTLYLQAECATPVTASGPGWMRLLLRTGSQPAWEGFDYIVNRERPGVLERSLGSWRWQTVAEVPVDVQGSIVTVALPLASLGLGGAFEVKFKWSDNMQRDGDPLDFYIHGNCAPGGRFAFVYRAKD